MNMWLAIVIAALAPMVIGYLWYGPLFGKKWMELMETSEEEVKASFNAVKSYGGSFVAALITAYVLHEIMGMGDGNMMSLMGGLKAGLLVWFGFVLTHGYQAVCYEGKTTGLFVLNQAYNLVSLAAMGAILGSL